MGPCYTASVAVEQREAFTTLVTSTLLLPSCSDFHTSGPTIAQCGVEAIGVCLVTLGMLASAQNSGTYRANLELI